MGDDRVTAVYLMALTSELKPEDQGSFDRLLTEQKEACMRLIETQVGKEAAEPVEVYTSRSMLLKSVEHKRVKRLVVFSLDRLGSRGDVEAILFELRSEGIPVLTVVQ